MPAGALYSKGSVQGLASRDVEVEVESEGKEREREKEVFELASLKISQIAVDQAQSQDPYLEESLQTHCEQVYLQHENAIAKRAFSRNKERLLSPEECSIPDRPHSQMFPIFLTDPQLVRSLDLDQY